MTRYTCRAEFEFRLSRQEVAQHANSDCGLRQPSLPKLMGTAEFDIKLKINKMSACGATRVVLNDIIIYYYIIQWFDYVLLSNEALRGRVMMCKVLKILLTKVARNHVTWWQRKSRDFVSSWHTEFRCNICMWWWVFSRDFINLTTITITTYFIHNLYPSKPCWPCGYKYTEQMHKRNRLWLRSSGVWNNSHGS